MNGNEKSKDKWKERKRKDEIEIYSPLDRKEPRGQQCHVLHFSIFNSCGSPIYPPIGKVLSTSTYDHTYRANKNKHATGSASIDHQARNVLFGNWSSQAAFETQHCPSALDPKTYPWQPSSPYGILLECLIRNVMLTLWYHILKDGCKYVQRAFIRWQWLYWRDT